ncbi:MAG: ATP-binding protein [Anaerococcus obesiensis]
MEEDKLSKIFEQFYRLDFSRNSKGGSGLGLAIAKEIVLLHKGEISAESKDNCVKFCVILPKK